MTTLLVPHGRLVGPAVDRGSPWPRKSPVPLPLHPSPCYFDRKFRVRKREFREGGGGKSSFGESGS